MDLIQLEHSFAVAIGTEIVERDRVLSALQKRLNEVPYLILLISASQVDMLGVSFVTSYRFLSSFYSASWIAQRHCYQRTMGKSV